jgi:Rrf2 family protein
MAKVLQRLAKNGLLASHQGTRGGYHLARPSTEITDADVIQAIDGPVMVTACSTTDERCDQYSTCNVRDPLWRLKDRIVQALAACTISELASDRLPDQLFPAPLTRRPVRVEPPQAAPLAHR